MDLEKVNIRFSSDDQPREHTFQRCDTRHSVRECPGLLAACVLLLRTLESYLRKQDFELKGTGPIGFLARPLKNSICDAQRGRIVWPKQVFGHRDHAPVMCDLFVWRSQKARPSGRVITVRVNDEVLAASDIHVIYPDGKCLECPDAISQLIDSLTEQDTDSSFTAEPIADADLAWFTKMDLAAYTVEDYSNIFLRTWRDAFPEGCIGFFVDGSLAGGLGMWPLSDNTANNLKKGIYGTESEIQIAQRVKDDIVKYWYFGGVFLIKEMRNQRLFVPLLERCLKTWVQNGRAHMSGPVEIIVAADHLLIPSTLTSHGFESCGSEIDGCELFCRQFASVDSLATSINEMMI